MDQFFRQSTVTPRQAVSPVKLPAQCWFTKDDDVTVLVTVESKQADPGKGFLPLVCPLPGKKTYAAGKILASFRAKAVLPEKENPDFPD